MTPTKNSVRDVPDNTKEKYNSYPKKVGPLPHLSSKHWEISPGVPLIPRPPKPPPPSSSSLDVDRRFQSMVRNSTSCLEPQPPPRNNLHDSILLPKDTPPSYHGSFGSETQNSDAEIVQSQRQNRLGLWNGTIDPMENLDTDTQHPSTSSTKKEEDEEEEEWVEYWDEEVETCYYYNVKTGEASWYNPKDR